MISKHSLSLKGHATSITLEDIFWKELKVIAAQQDCSVPDLVNRIDEDRLTQKNAGGGLSSAIRVYILQWVKDHPLPDKP